MTNDKRQILTRVGIVLIAVGILEFAYFWSTLDDPQCILSSNPSPTSSSPGSAILVV
ncbi:MAG: hypothetical protein RIG66_09540 [Coleofasciculus sp. E2-BRE-01]